MKLLLISGSLRSGSYNTAIINFLAKQCTDGKKIESTIYKELHLIPPFNPDLDVHDLKQDSSPKKVKELRAAVKNSDAVIIATPEYAFEIPGALKNALDWLISSGEFIDKPTMVISSSTSAAGGESAYAVLIKLLKILSAKVVEDKPINIDRVNKKIDENGSIMDNDLADKLVASLEFLYARTMTTRN
jgi:chromate reductase, NAD(P)H dehydrogenase (quinone)